MDTQSIINYVTVVAAGATVVATQILKSPFIPVGFEKHPVPTTGLVSLVATYIALLSQHFDFAWSNWTKMLGTFLIVLLVAALTYNHVIKNWVTSSSIPAPVPPVPSSSIPSVGSEPSA